MAFIKFFIRGLILYAHALLAMRATASSGNFEISHLAVDGLSEVDATSEADSFLCCKRVSPKHSPIWNSKPYAKLKIRADRCFQLISVIKTHRKIHRRTAVSNGRLDNCLQHCRPRVHAQITTLRYACPRVSTTASRI